MLSFYIQPIMLFFFFKTHLDVLFILFFLLHFRACRILVPWPEIEHVPPTVEVWSPRHWTTMEFLDAVLTPDTKIEYLVDLWLCQYKEQKKTPRSWSSCKKSFWDILGHQDLVDGDHRSGPMVEAPHLQGKRHRLSVWLGNKDPTCQKERKTWLTK